MDHEAYEKEMIDSVNRNAESKTKVVTKADKAALKAGIICVLISILTAALFALAVFGLILTAKVTGYLAVLTFFASIFVGICAFILLLAQGLIVTKA